jgi:peptidoglycan hydrolase-like protein with peptidoglycan-binding domain
MPYHDVDGDHPDLAMFAKGGWVRYAQDLLAQHGANLGIHGADGFYGPDTAAAVVDFQGKQNPPIMADGAIGQDTWRALGAFGQSAPLLELHDPPQANGTWVQWSVCNKGDTDAGAGQFVLGNLTIMDDANLTGPVLNQQGVDVNVPPVSLPNNTDVPGHGGTENAGFDLGALDLAPGLYHVMVQVGGHQENADVTLP